jgi:hypothetical protein
LIGNASAHDPDFDLEEPEAMAAVEFVEEVIRDVFILPERRKKTLARLPSRAPKPTP